MRARTFFWIVLTLAAAGGIYTAVERPELVDELKSLVTKHKKKPVLKKTLSEPVNTALAAGNYAQAQQLLVDSVRKSKLTAPQAPATLAVTMPLEFLRCTGTDVLTEFATTPERREFLMQFLNDSRWLELYLGAGLVPYQTDRGIKVLYDIWKEEGGDVGNKALAVALASVWGGGETQPDPAIAKLDPVHHNPLRRYKFFRAQEKAGNLHPNYKNLRPWELRFVVGNVAQDWDDGSFEWCAKNINLPWDRYQSSCWAAVYTDPSYYGDSVQSGEYQWPFLTESRAELTHKNGGVCGSMSHLGAWAAMAHGIPAYTCGQPGHCAYAVRPERGKWIGGFGGPDGGMHTNIFGNQAPTSYLLMETVFKDDKTIDKAYRQSFAARALEAAGDKKAARKMWNKALKTSPLHPFFRRELHRLMKEEGLSPEACVKYLTKVIPLYQGNGFAAVDMAQDLQEQIDAMTDAQRASIYTLMHEMISETPASWAVKCSDLVDKQNKTLKTPEARADYLASLLGIHMNHGDGTTFGQIIEWAVANYIEKGDIDTFSQAFTKASAQAGDAHPAAADDQAAQERNKKLAAAYGKAIFAAEKAHSIPGFQALTQAAQALAGECASEATLTQPANIPGRPCSDKGIIMLSSTSQWDVPSFHRNIMTLKGGKSHTNKENAPSFTIELPKAHRLTGCVIRKSNGIDERMKKAIVYTSADGATWMKAAETDNMPKVWEVPFNDTTSGKWVKVVFDNGSTPNFAYLSHFVVFVK